MWIDENGVGIDVWTNVHCYFAYILASSFISFQFPFQFRLDIFGSFDGKKKQSKFNASSVRYRCSTVAHSQLKKKHASIFTFQFFWHLFISKSMRALNLQWFRWFRVHELPSLKLLCTAFAEQKFDKILFCIIWLSALAINRFWFCLFGLCIRSVVWFEYYEFCRERFIVWMAIELEIIMISCTLDEHRITAKMIFRI